VGAAEGGKDVRHHRLHAEADPVHAVSPIGVEELGRHGVGIALDGDLRADDERDGVEHVHQGAGWDHRWRPSAEEHARRRRHPARDRSADVGEDRRQVVGGEMVTVRPRGEGAVVATPGAERDVDVDAERRAVTG
jgi:hypothetical protein